MNANRVRIGNDSESLGDFFPILVLNFPVSHYKLVGFEVNHGINIIRFHLIFNKIVKIIQSLYYHFFVLVGRSMFKMLLFNRM